MMHHNRASVVALDYSDQTLAEANALTPQMLVFLELSITMVHSVERCRLSREIWNKFSIEIENSEK